MQIKKLLALSASVCGLISAENGFASTSNGVRFTAALRLAGSLQKEKSETRIAQGAIADAVSKIIVLNDSAANAVNAPTAQYVGGLASNDDSSNQARIAAAHFNYKPNDWAKGMMSGTWESEGKMVVGGQLALAVGAKINNTVVKGGALVEFPFSNKTEKISFSSSSSTKASDSNNSNNNDNSNSNSSSTTNSQFDITETKKTTYGFFVGVDFEIGDCFTVGVEGGIKRLHREYDVSNANKNLLGFGGVPDNLPEGISKTELQAESELLKRAEGFSTVDKFKAITWVPYGGLNFGFKFNKYCTAMFGFGLQGRQSFQLYNGSSKNEKPDYTVRKKTGYYVNLGLQIQL